MCARSPPARTHEKAQVRPLHQEIAVCIDRIRFRQVLFNESAHFRQLFFSAVVFVRDSVFGSVLDKEFRRR